MIWLLMHPDATPEVLGFLPDFLDEADPRGAVEQIDDRYRMGGWHDSVVPFRVVDDGAGLVYPGDPVLPLVAMTRLRDEVIRLYAHAYVSVTQPDGSVRIAKID